MSPNEFDLRAALHEGEGDSVNPDRIIAHAVGVRHARRVRLATVAAAVVAVGAVGVGASMLTSRSHRQTASGSTASVTSKAGGGYAAQGGAGAAVPSAPSAAARAAPSGPMADQALAAGCPASPPNLMLPGGGGSGQFGSTSALFPGTVTGMTVCGYPAGAPITSAPPVPLVLDAEQAAEVAASLDAASKSLGTAPCAAPEHSYRPSQLVIYATTADGKALGPVVVTTGCAGRATNGTAVRYAWQPPAVVAAFLARLDAAQVTSVQQPVPTATTDSASPHVSGSPAH